MKTKKHLILSLILGMAILISCNQKKIPVNNTKKENYGWVASVTSAKGYPIEVHKGYLATKDKFIMAFSNTGVEDNGWQVNG